MGIRRRARELRAAGLRVAMAAADPSAEPMSEAWLLAAEELPWDVVNALKQQMAPRVPTAQRNKSHAGRPSCRTDPGPVFTARRSDPYLARAHGG